jgi:hypothetical protein
MELFPYSQPFCKYSLAKRAAGYCNLLPYEKIKYDSNVGFITPPAQILNTFDTNIEMPGSEMVSASTTITHVCIYTFLTSAAHLLLFVS